jgi:hypothetical protein
VTSRLAKQKIDGFERERMKKKGKRKGFFPSSVKTRAFTSNLFIHDDQMRELFRDKN